MKAKRIPFESELNVLQIKSMMTYYSKSIYFFTYPYVNIGLTIVRLSDDGGYVYHSCSGQFEV